MRKRTKSNQIRQAEMRVWRKMLDDDSISISDIVSALVTLAVTGNALAREEIDRVSKMHTTFWTPEGHKDFLTVKDGALVWICKPQEAL